MPSTLKPLTACHATRVLAMWGVVVAAVLASGCSSMRVHTIPAPDADFSQRRTFRILEASIPVDTGTIELAATERPMLNNEITNQVIRNQIRRAFEKRGYVLATDGRADLDIAFYAKARERIEIRNYSTTYCYDCVDINEFTEGTIVLDVIDPLTDRLLWRGTGVASVSDNPRKYLRKVDEAVEEIVGDFPIAAGAVYAVRPR